MARSLVLPLRRLRAGALDVASVQLPERVKRLSESPDPAADLEVAPIAVLSTDEIGQVARAFDQVHAEAVRLAGDEAVLRTSFNAMFVNLSRRSQSLIERLARMIDSLEQNEDDPDRLSNLFSMDHLVTRMRRNSENLLLLAGHESPRKWTEPVPLADVARAATSEIEQYDRVALNVQPGRRRRRPGGVRRRAPARRAHRERHDLLPEGHPVQVSAQELTSGGVLIEVTDKGIGVSESRLAEMNWRLDNPPMIDVSVSRHMGLFAVARLAERHRIRIRLRPASPQGLTALVWLPDTRHRAVGAHLHRHRVLAAACHAERRLPPAQARLGSAQHRRRCREPAQLRQARPRAGRGLDGHRRAVSPCRSRPARRRRTGSAAGTRRWAPSRGCRSTAAATGTAPTTATAPARTTATASTTGTAPTTATDPRSATPSGAPGQQPGGRGADSGAGWGSSDTGSWGAADTGSWSTGGRRPADIVADPAQGDQTSAGLPLRVPKANLIPGSAPGARNGGGAPGGAAPGGGNGLPSRQEETAPRRKRCRPRCRSGHRTWPAAG